MENYHEMCRIAVICHDVISRSAQMLYALRVLRAKGMPDDALQVVFRSVIVGKLLCVLCDGIGYQPIEYSLGLACCMYRLPTAESASGRRWM